MVAGMKFCRDSVRAWEHEGVLCCVKHQPRRGARHSGLNGYAFVPPGHPWNDSHEESEAADVWGGLTYGRSFDGGTWIGFDDGHCEPCPRDMQEEVERLAHQIHVRGLVGRALAIVTMASVAAGALLAGLAIWWVAT